jgi:hypothetical protein
MVRASRQSLDIHPAYSRLAEFEGDGYASRSHQASEPIVTQTGNAPFEPPNLHPFLRGRSSHKVNRHVIFSFAHGASISHLHSFLSWTILLNIPIIVIVVFVLFRASLVHSAFVFSH